MHGEIGENSEISCGAAPATQSEIREISGWASRTWTVLRVSLVTFGQCNWIARAKETRRGGMSDYGLGMCYLRSFVAVRDKTCKMCQS